MIASESKYNMYFFKRTGKIISLFCAVLFFIQSNSILFVSYDTNIKRYIYLISIVLALISLIMTMSLYFVNQQNILPEIVLIFFLICSCAAMYIGTVLNGGKFEFNTFYTYFVLLIVFILWSKYLQSVEMNNYLLVIFRKLVTVYAGVSLIMWLVCSVLKIIQPTSSIFISWGSIHPVPVYLHLYAQSQEPITFLGFEAIRNTGMFAEAPMYSFVLSIALLVHSFVEKKMNRFTILLMITIITTASTTGTLVVLLVLFIRLSELMIRSKYRNMLVPITVTLLVSGFILLVTVVILKILQSDGSVSVRMDDFNAGYITWMQHPLFGIGLFNDGPLISNMNPARWPYLGHVGNVGFSSGFMKILAGGGLIFTIIFLICPVMINFLISIRRKNMFWGVSVGLVMIISISLVQNLYLFIFLIGWMWSNFINPKNGGN